MVATQQDSGVDAGSPQELYWKTPVRLSWARGMVLIEHQELFPADPLAWSRGE